MPPITPREFAWQNLHLVRQGWRGVLDTDRNSIHEVRVALRRFRAALAACGDSDADRRDLCRTLGRLLGGVREIDVTDEVLENVGARVPAAACAVAAVRRDVAVRRDRDARRLVKGLEDVELRPLRLLSRRGIPLLTFWKDWRHPLASALRTTTHRLRDAIDRAPAVYMPNRLHRLRIAVKKVRYILEVADAAAIPIDRYLTRDFRKTQDILGQMHDLHIAQKTVRRFDASTGSLATEVTLLQAVMAADCTALHARYLQRRDRLRAFCEYGATLAGANAAAQTARVVMRALPVAGLVMLPLALSRIGSSEKKPVLA
jgi:CHAD domain-containing protein